MAEAAAFSGARAKPASGWARRTNPSGPARSEWRPARQCAANLTAVRRRVLQHAIHQKKSGDPVREDRRTRLHPSGRGRSDDSDFRHRPIDLTMGRGHRRALVVGLIRVVVQPLMKRGRRRHGQHEQIRSEQNRRDGPLQSLGWANSVHDCLESIRRTRPHVNHRSSPTRSHYVGIAWRNGSLYANELQESFRKLVVGGAGSTYEAIACSTRSTATFCGRFYFGWILSGRTSWPWVGWRPAVRTHRCGSSCRA